MQAMKELMIKIEMKKYRVEAFIVPTNVNKEVDSNQIDDVKLAKKLKDLSISSLDETIDQQNNHEDEKNLNIDSKICPKVKDQSSLEFSEVFFEIDEHIYDEIVLPEKKQEIKFKEVKPNTEYTKAFFRVEEPVYDEPFVGSFTKIKYQQKYQDNAQQSPWILANSKYRRFGMVAPKLPKRSSSLKSIVEDIEQFDETLQEICCHGHKNGCLPNHQRPEDISEDIFKENWMQRLDALRKLEALLKDKEVALQSRERLLFKKEKELRILERLVKDKMKQAELYAKRYKKSVSSESILSNDRDLESRSSNGSKGYGVKSEDCLTLPSLRSKTNSRLSLESRERILKNPPNSRSSLTSDRLSNRIGSVRLRSKPKIRYDDLDSTLSADIGDSSFVVTSRKFDPETFKKPAAFIRSASERRPKLEMQIKPLRLSSVTEKNEHGDDFAEVIEEKMFKKISENILASQNNETKFLNYGLIDEKSSVNVSAVNQAEAAYQKRFSYLNLESINKAKSKIITKDRPTSWSEDTDDWLKKKRLAYNMATNKTLFESAAEKENLNDQTRVNKSLKIHKKKENGRKKFSIFR